MDTQPHTIVGESLFHSIDSLAGQHSGRILVIACIYAIGVLITYHLVQCVIGEDFCNGLSAGVALHGADEDFHVCIVFYRTSDAASRKEVDFCPSLLFSAELSFHLLY